MSSAARPCEYCGQLFVPRKSDQRFHNMACRGAAKRVAGPNGQGRADAGGIVTRNLIRGSSPEKLARIRRYALQLADGPDSPEMQLVALIDQAARR